MKKFVVDSGASLIELSAWIVLFAVIIVSVVMMFGDFITGLLILLVGIVLFILFYFSLFLLIDINDNLTEINSKLGKKKAKDTLVKSTEEQEDKKDEFVEKYLK